METNPFRKIWEKEPIVIFDANVLLNLYSFTIDAIEDIIHDIRMFYDNIWLPKQVVEEFNTNRGRVVKKVFGKLENTRREVDSILDDTINKLIDKSNLYKRYRYPLFEKILEEIIQDIRTNSKKLKELDDDISREKSCASKFIHNDAITCLLEDLIKDKKIGKGFTYSQLINIYVEGDTRYRLRIPPGFKDANKGNYDNPSYDERRKYGDLIIWKEILLKAKDEKKIIIFITDDEKQDWWDMELQPSSGVLQSKSRKVPNKGLIEEFNEEVSGDSEFHMFTFAEFIENISGIKEFEKEFMCTYFESNKVKIFEENISKQISINNSFLVPLYNDVNRVLITDNSSIVYEIRNIEINSVDYTVLEEFVRIIGTFSIELSISGNFPIFRSLSKKNMIVIVNCVGDIYLDKRNYKSHNPRIASFNILYTQSKEELFTHKDNLDIYDIYDLKIRMEEEEFMNDSPLYDFYSHIEFVPYEEVYFGIHNRYEGRYDDD